MHPDQPITDRPVPDPPTGASRVILAGIGLIGLIGDEILAWIQRRAADAGAIAPARPPQFAPLPEKLSRQAQTELNQQLSQLGILTHTDLQALLQHLTELEQQIDQITARRQSGS